MQVTASPATTRDPTLSWYNLSDEVKQLLIAAANTWEDTAQSQHYIQQALEQSNQSLDVLVAAYRYFFYKHDNTTALQIATQVVTQIQQLESLPEDWAELAPILSQRKEESPIRLYLNAYVASGLVRARLGAIDEATLITSRVSAIDDKREFGATMVLQVLTHLDDDEE